MKQTITIVELERCCMYVGIDEVRIWRHAGLWHVRAFGRLRGEMISEDAVSI